MLHKDIRRGISERKSERGEGAREREGTNIERERKSKSKQSNEYKRGGYKKTEKKRDNYTHIYIERERER
jgi:hypothetical protein